MRNLFVICGGVRTFLDCIDNIYDNVISQLFDKNDEIYIYFYLKLTDPGPRYIVGFNYAYTDLEQDKVLNKINEFNKRDPKMTIYHKILKNSEINDEELMRQVKDRSRYVNYMLLDNILLRGLHFFYNFECCGKYILELEKEKGFMFDNIVYSRPDLYFTEKCKSINEYVSDRVVLGTGINSYSNDQIAIIPRKYLKHFFFDRMELFRTNTRFYCESNENVYWQTIPFVVEDIGKYQIKREKVFPYTTEDVGKPLATL